MIAINQSYCLRFKMMKIILCHWQKFPVSKVYYMWIKKIVASPEQDILVNILVNPDD